MPGSQLHRISFYGFGRGEYGRADSWDIGWRLLRQQLYYAGWFSATNIQRYVNGTLGPRSGLVDVTPSGMPTGKILGFTWTPVPLKNGLFCVGTTIYDFNAEATGSAATAYTGTLNSTPTEPLAFAVDANGITWASNRGDAIYKIDQNTRTVTRQAASAGLAGRALAIYGSRLMSGNPDDNHLNYVYYSAAGDFTTWPAANYAQVGDAWPVNGLYPQRTHLIVAKQNAFWIWTGVPGVNDVLRSAVVNGPWLQSPGAGGMAGDNTLYFVDFYKDTPSSFNGAVTAEDKDLSFNGLAYSESLLPPAYAVRRNLRREEIMLAAATTAGGALKLALFQEGAWTLHSFTVPNGFRGAWVSPGTSGRVHFSDGGNTGVAAKFYSWRTHLDRPPISGNDLESSGDAASTALNPTLTFPEWWDRGGGEVVVRGLAVDFTRYNHGYSFTNHFDAQVQALNRYGDPSATPPVGLSGAVFTQPYDEPASAAGSAGASSLARVSWGFDGELGNGFVVSFANVRGVAIKKVELAVQMSSSRGF